MKKRILSILLCLAMLATVLPVAAFADAYGGTVTVENGTNRLKVTVATTNDAELDYKIALIPVSELQEANSWEDKDAAEVLSEAITMVQDATADIDSYAGTLSNTTIAIVTVNIAANARTGSVELSSDDMENVAAAEDNTPIDYIAIGYAGTNTGDAIGSTFQLNKDKKIPVQYTVTYDVDGGDATLSNATVDGGDSVTLPSAGTKSGYLQRGWKNAGGTVVGQAGASYKPTANVTLTAVWKAEATLVYDLNGATGTAPTDAGSRAEDDTVTLSTAAQTRTGYAFGGWADSAASTTKITSKKLAAGENKVYAIWTANNLTMADVKDVTATYGTAITTITLPEASNGTGDYTYTLTGDLPSGLAYDKDAKTITGTPDAVDAGKTLTWKAVDDNSGKEITKTFKITVKPAAFTGTVTIAVTDTNNDGTANIGETLTAADSGANTTFGYQWKRDGVDIPGATNGTYVVTTDDMGKKITCTIAPDDKVNYTGSASSNQIVPGKKTLSGAPKITGEGEVGATLTLNKDTLPVELDEFDIQWKVDGAPISGATGITYEVQPEDQGKTISATVTAKEDSTYGGSADSSNQVDIAEIPVGPSAPQDLAVVPGDGTLTVTWKAPAEIGTKPLKHYVISVDGEVVKRTTSLSAELPGLENGTEYTITVTAVTEVGESDPATVKGTPVAAVVEPEPEPHIAYINGRPDDVNGGVKFVPDDNLPRSEAAIILARVTEGFDKDTTYAATKFVDLDGEYCANYVAFCVANNLIMGKTETTFEPKTNVTRAEFATMLARMYYGGDEYVPDDTCERFTDGTASGKYYEKYIAVLEDFITGYPDGSFRPGNEITRAEAVTMVNAVLGRSQSTKTTDPQLEVKSIFPDVTSGQWFFNNVMEATNEHDKDAPLFNIDANYHH